MLYICTCTCTCTYMHVHVCTLYVRSTHTTCIHVAASVEILQKEVVVHKEMVAELRTQLAEKEQEFQVSWEKIECNISHSLV